MNKYSESVKPPIILYFKIPLIFQPLITCSCVLIESGNLVFAVNTTVDLYGDGDNVTFGFLYKFIVTSQEFEQSQ